MQGELQSGCLLTYSASSFSVLKMKGETLNILLPLQHLYDISGWMLGDLHINKYFRWMEDSAEFKWSTIGNGHWTLRSDGNMICEDWILFSIFTFHKVVRNSLKWSLMTPNDLMDISRLFAWRGLLLLSSWTLVGCPGGLPSKC